MIGVAASAVSLVWLALVFGWVALPGDDGKLLLLFVIALDFILFALGVFGVVRGVRYGRSWLVAAIAVITPCVHYAGSIIAGEGVVLFFAVPTIVIIAATFAELVQGLIAKRRLCTLTNR